MNTKTAWQLSSSLFLCILSSGCHCDHPKTQEQPVDACEGYSGLTASLGVATVNCTNTIGPDSFFIDRSVNEKGLLSNKFKCSEDPEGEKLARVTKILEMQTFEKLPRFRECLTDHYTRWSKLFGQMTLNSCPKWSDPKDIGANYRESTVQLSKMQPMLQYISAKERAPRFAPTGNESLVDILVPSKTTLVYQISYPQGEGTCGDPAVCAAQCAAFLPGFVVSAGRGQVVVDPVSWYQDESANCLTAPTGPFCPPFVHAMSVTRTSYSSQVPPGDIYGNPHRADTGERCFRFVPDPAGGPGSNYATDLVMSCVHSSTGTLTDCMSKCGN